VNESGWRIPGRSVGVDDGDDQASARLEPPRLSRRPVGLSQAAMADSSCWRSYAISISNSAGGTLPIGSSNRR